MSEKKRFLLRVDERLYAALEKWAADELRSVNSQIEYALQEALRRRGRLKSAGAAPPLSDQAADDNTPERN
jgi:hypothetical protein